MPTCLPRASSLCGIFGCVLHDGKEAAPLIHAALKRLEYRGYDSVGEVTIADGTLTVKKDSGRLDEVHAKYNLDLLPGPVGVGHTRWSTANPESPSSTMASLKTISTSNANSKRKGTGSPQGRTLKLSRTWLRNISATGLAWKRRSGKLSIGWKEHTP